MLVSDDMAVSVVSWRRLVIPLALLAILIVGLVAADPARWFDNGAPAAEDLTFDRVTLREGVIELDIRNTANAPVSIAQVMVDDAFWSYEIDRDPTLGPFDAATITITYPWVEGEPHVVALITNTGLVWEHEIVVALLTPQPQPQTVGAYALIGLLVGFVPVAAGMTFYPLMRQARPEWTAALLALTLGLLTFLAIDATSEGIELAGELPSAYHGLTLFVGAALLAILTVLLIERALARKASPAFTLALLIAIGIGIHNLGEGLLIGSAFALGSLALGSALITGFAIHNVTEGPAIVAPLATSARERFMKLAVLAIIAGVPTVLGAWLGGFARGQLLPVVFFGLGAGAVIVVLLQVTAAMRREGDALLTGRNMLAFLAGYAVMYLTSFLTA